MNKTISAPVDAPQQDIIVNDAKRDSQVYKLKKLFESKMDLPQDPQ